MIAEKSEELFPSAERIRRLEEKELIEPEIIKLTTDPSLLPLPRGLAQALLQEDRKMPELRLLTFDSRLHEAAAEEGIAANF